MNSKIIGGLLALVLIVQVVLVGTGTKMSDKISGITAQQASILYKVDQMAGVGGSGILEPDTGGISVTTWQFYLFGRCTETVTNFSDTGAITSVTTTPGTTNGDECVTVGFAQTNEINDANANFVLLGDGGISITNSKDVVKTQFRINKSR